MAQDFSQLAQDILENIGGKENVKSVMHCVTRVRFVLKDDEKADDKKVESLKGVMKVIRSGEQYQVVIGAQVKNVYDAVLKAGDFKDGGNLDVNEDKAPKKDKLVASAEAHKKKQDPITKFLSLVSGIFAPALGGLVASGMIKAVVVLLNLTGVLPNDCGAYTLLSAIGDACLYFFPVVVGWSAAKKFGLKEIYGIILGAILVYPTLTALSGAEAVYTIFEGSFLEASVQTTFFGIPVLMRDYSSSVIPIILIVWIASKINQWLEEHIPAMIQSVFVPLILLSVASLLGLLIIGPVAMVIQNLLSASVSALVNFNTGIAGLILGTFWSILVMFGLHWAVIPFFAINIAQYGFDMINPLIYAGTFASMGSVVGLILREKNPEEKLIEIPALVSTFFGVNEPTLYGVLIPRKKIMATCFLGAGIGGMIAGFSGAKLWAFGASGIFGTPCFINPEGIDIGFIGLLVGAAAAFIFAMVTAMILGPKKDGETEDAQ